MSSLYDILGVDSDADLRTIKSAFRSLAKETHPDLNPDDPDAEEQFKRVLAAFRVLSDSEKRRRYDKYGYDGLRSGFDPTEESSSRRDHGSDEDDDVGSVFSDIFDGRSPMDTSHMKDFGGFNIDIDSGRDLTADITIDFLTSVRGGAATVELPGETVEIDIPAGIEDGDTLVFKGEGAPATGVGGDPGDLRVGVTVDEHPVLSRDGLDLLLDVPVTMSEAIRGATIRLPTPHGEYDVTIPSGVDSGRKLRLEGLGIRTRTRTGDLFAVVRIHTPDQIDDTVREAADTLDDSYTVPVRRDLIIE